MADEFKNGAVPVRVGDGVCQQPRPKAKPSTSPPSFCNTRLYVLQGIHRGRDVSKVETFQHCCRMTRVIKVRGMLGEKGGLLVQRA